MQVTEPTRPQVFPPSVRTTLVSLTVFALVACSGGRDVDAPVTPVADARDEQPPPSEPGPISQLLTSLPLVNGGGPALPGVQGPQLPLNALEMLLSLTASELTEMLEPRLLTEPALAPVPRAECDENSQPLAEIVQGRVTVDDMNSAQSARGWTCNTSLVGHVNAPGGFRVWRYTDKTGRDCAYFDTSFAAPANIVSLLAGPSLGVMVLDMADPTQPEMTTVLRTLAMLAPHETLNLHAGRGLLAATTGSGLTLPGALSIYDVSEDCRDPVLKSQAFIPFGHESGFSPDGNTFWVAGGAGYIQAVDVKDPEDPEVVWTGAYYSHGLTLTDNGNILVHTDPINANLGLIDVSEIQARKENPETQELSRVTWPMASIPQNTIPYTQDGQNYLIEFDEFAFRFNPPTIDDQVGAARILNIDDPSNPYVVSNIRLEVHMQEQHRAASVDPSSLPPTQVFGYSMHYCAIPRTESPQIVACSAMNSGLRVFNINDPSSPREVAYFVAPPRAGSTAGLLPGNLAMSQPAFVPERREIWYTDASSGFYVLRLSEEAWPEP